MNPVSPGHVANSCGRQRIVAADQSLTAAPFWVYWGMDRPLVVGRSKTMPWSLPESRGLRRVPGSPELARDGRSGVQLALDERAAVVLDLNLPRRTALTC